MLVDPRHIGCSHPVVDNTTNPPSGDKREPSSLIGENGSPVFVAAMDENLAKSVGQLQQGKTTHFYSWGNFNLVRLILHILKQTGPAHAFMTSYSFSQKSIEQLVKRYEQQELLSFRVIIDNRVRTMSPKPFQMLMESFPYRCTSVHAKVALIWNDRWTITILTSQNATDNPKLERGAIYTDQEVFIFDKMILENEFERGTT